MTIYKLRKHISEKFTLGKAHKVYFRNSRIISFLDQYIFILNLKTYIKMLNEGFLQLWLDYSKSTIKHWSESLILLLLEQLAKEEKE